MGESTIVHISEVNITPNSGMGRVEFYWEQAIRRAGYDFVHIGPNEVGRLIHKSFFSLKAYLYYRGIKKNVVAIIAHEPSSIFFINKKIPVFIESHGIENRYWEDIILSSGLKVSLKTRILYPLWRLFPCNFGLRRASKLLLINNEDKEYVIKKFRRLDSDIFIFRNGVEMNIKAKIPQDFNVLFNGSWIERKGIKLLIDAATILYKKNYKIQYTLIGTGKGVAEVLNEWPEFLKSDVSVVPFFETSEENLFLSGASVVVLPSYFEGQPLSILQAMAAGKCCITTNADGQKDFIINGINGLLFNKKDSNELANLITNCFENRDMVRLIGDNARNSMKDRNWNQVSDEVVRYLNNYISNFRK